MAKKKPLPKIAVFCSGRGSNFEAIAKSIAKGGLRCEIACMFSDNSEAYAFTRAERLDIPSIYINPKSFNSREDYEKAIVKELKFLSVEWIVLAGYMRLLTPYFIKKYKNRIVNIHPSLLPAFKGADAIGDALSYGVKVTGVTVHLVDEQMDNGPIILQKAVEIKEDDNRESLADRIHRVEHKLYPQALNILFSRNWKVVKKRRFVLS